MAIRLEESSTIELVVRNRDSPQTGAEAITRVGARIVGRYWYDVAEGEHGAGADTRWRDPQSLTMGRYS